MDKLYEQANSGKACFTVGSEGIGPNHACVFPFTYKSVTYNACTSVDWGKPWCPTASGPNIDFNHQWGLCNNACQKTSGWIPGSTHTASLGYQQPKWPACPVDKDWKSQRCDSLVRDAD